MADETAGVDVRSGSLSDITVATRYVANSGHSKTILFAHIYDDVRCGEQKREARFIEHQRSQRQDTKF
jgi:hypothetical protein